MNFVFKIALLIFTIPCVSIAQNWSQLTDFPGTARDDGSVFTINNKAFCLTGMQVGYSCTRDGAVLDASSNTWTSMSSIPIGNERQYACAFSYNGYGYIFGGLVCGGKGLRDLWRYDPGADTWLKLGYIPTQGRYACSCFVLNGKAFVVGGRDTLNNVLSEVWQYDISTNIWSVKNNISFGGFWRGCGFAIDTSGYVCYGMKAGGSFQRKIYRYSISADMWTPVPNLILNPRYYAGCAVVTNEACMYGGLDSVNVMHNDLLVFNPSIPSLTPLPGLPSPSLPRKGCMAFSLNNRLYVTTGIDSTVTRIKETWQSLSPTKIDEITFLENVFAVFPCPSKETFIFEVRESYIPYKLFVYDIRGKIIFSQIITEASTRLGVVEMCLTPGYYCYQARTEKKIIGSGKLIVLDTGN